MFTKEEQAALNHYTKETRQRAFATFSRHNQAHPIKDPFTYCLALCRKIEAGNPFNSYKPPHNPQDTPQAQRRILHIASNRPWFKKSMSVDQARKKLTQEVLSRRHYQ